MRFKPLVLVRGAGEMATAVSHRLFRARFRVVLSVPDDPLALFRGNTFRQTTITGSYEVEGITAYRAVVTEAVGLVDREMIPFLTARFRNLVDVLNPEIIVDAREPGAEMDLTVGDASLVIGIGKGFDAGENCDLVVDDSLGPDVGRIIYRGPVSAAPAPETGHPLEKILVKTKSAGSFDPCKRIGQAVRLDEVLGQVGEEKVLVLCSGVVSGLIQAGVEVPAGAAVAEILENEDENACFAISARGRTISGGILEAVVAWVADVGGFPCP